MPIFAAIPLIALCCAAGACAAYYAVVWWRVVRANTALPTLRQALQLPQPPGDFPSTCLVIPAHNERDVIATLARSLAALDEPHGRVRFVFVLDRCTDDTEAVLRHALGPAAERTEIINNDQCPDGWAGKTHAIWRGVRDSRAAQSAELLCFADADTQFHPQCLHAAWRLMHDRKLDLLSLLSTLTADTWFERTAQPAAGIELVRQFPLDLVNRPGSGRAFANGQFMLFKRAAYDRLGGHEKVKAELLEDLALARNLMWLHKDMRLGVFLADGMLRCRMYRSWEAFRRGWKRIYTEAVRRKASRMRAQAWRQAITGAILPTAAPLALVLALLVLKLGDAPLGWSLMATGASGVYAFCGAIGRAYRAQGLGARWLPLYPIGALLTALIQAEAARDLRRGTATTWAGKTYAREIRA